MLKEEKATRKLLNMEAENKKKLLEREKKKLETKLFVMEKKKIALNGKRLLAIVLLQRSLRLFTAKSRYNKLLLGVRLLQCVVRLRIRRIANRRRAAKTNRQLRQERVKPIGTKEKFVKFFKSIFSTSNQSKKYPGIGFFLSLFLSQSIFLFLSFFFL